MFSLLDIQSAGKGSLLRSGVRAGASREPAYLSLARPPHSIPTAHMAPYGTHVKRGVDAEKTALTFSGPSKQLSLFAHAQLISQTRPFLSAFTAWSTSCCWLFFFSLSHGVSGTYSAIDPSQRLVTTSDNNTPSHQFHLSLPTSLVAKNRTGN